jgi:signal transduction histidine kinase
VGGRVEVDGRPGRGTEVRLWVPVRSDPGGVRSVP